MTLLAQSPFGLDARPAFVQGFDRDIGLLGQSLGEALSRLGFGSLPAIHMPGQPDHSGSNFLFDDDLMERFQVLHNAPTLECTRGKCEPPLCVREGETNAFMAEIDAEHPHGGRL